MASEPTSAPQGDFEPLAATRLLMDAAPSFTARASGGAVALFVLVSLTWASFAKVDVIVTAPGVIVPADGTKVIQAPQPGTVQRIAVRDGQSVRRGDVLIELDSTAAIAERDRIARELRSVRLDIARLTAMLAEDPLTAFAPPADADTANAQLHRTQLKSDVERHQHRLGELDAALRRSEMEHARAREEQRKTAANLAYVAQKARAQQELVQQHLLPAQAGLDLQHAVREAELELRIRELALQELGASLEAQRHARAQEIDRYRSTTLSALNEARQSENRLQEDQSKAEVRLRNTAIASPVDGVVQQLAVHTIGGAVTEAQTLMTLVPLRTSLRINAWIGNRDVGYVRGDQRVLIKVDAFDFTQFGLWQGTIASVSDDAVTERRMDGPDETTRYIVNGVTVRTAGDSSYYLARIIVDAAPRIVDGVEVTLRPGMSVQAEIVVGERRAIQYFLSPVISSMHHPLGDR